MDTITLEGKVSKGIWNEMDTITLEGKVNKSIAGYWAIQTKHNLEGLRGTIVTIQIVGVKDAPETVKKVN